MSESEHEDSDIESGDSDRELQVAYASGLLKPGLNAPVEPKRPAINDVVGLTQTLAELSQDKLAWIERLDVCVPNLPDNKGLALEEQLSAGNLQCDVHDDFKREMTFYRQAQAAVLYAIPRLHELGVATERPEDYFAQMAKSDLHMKKVREKLVEKQTSMERSEKAKKLRELRKFGKKVQQDVAAKRQKEKKEMMEQVKKYRKGKEASLDFLEEGKTAQKASDKPSVNKKREAKNKKFGHGGQKKRGKMNTAASAGSMKEFDRGVHQSKPGAKKSSGDAPRGKPKGGNKNKPSKQNKAKRPGKNNRKKMRNKK